jgi:hypothetical protein
MANMKEGSWREKIEFDILLKEMPKLQQVCGESILRPQDMLELSNEVFIFLMHLLIFFQIVKILREDIQKLIS